MLNLYQIYNEPEILDGYCEHKSKLIDLFNQEHFNYNFDPIKHILKKEPITSYYYAKYVIKDRFIEAESTILKDSFFTRLYSTDIIKDRWLEAEPIIMTDPVDSHYYAHYIIKDRWIEAEPIIMNDPWAAWMYARHVIKERWFEAEEIIKKVEHWWIEYCNYFRVNDK